MKRNLFLLIALAPYLLTSGPAFAGNTIKVTDENYAHAETARNFRNWAKLGANKQITHMRELPPRGKAAPTVQMNDDTLYSVVIAENIDDHIRFTIPEVDVYMAVQVVTEGGHGQHYVVDSGDYNVPIETDFALLIYRTGTDKELDAARCDRRFNSHPIPPTLIPAKTIDINLPIPI